MSAGVLNSSLRSLVIGRKGFLSMPKHPGIDTVAVVPEIGDA